MSGEAGDKVRVAGRLYTILVDQTCPGRSERLAVQVPIGIIRRGTDKGRDRDSLDGFLLSKRSLAFPLALIYKGTVC